MIYTLLADTRSCLCTWLHVIKLLCRPTMVVKTSFVDVVSVLNCIGFTTVERIANCRCLHKFPCCCCATKHRMCHVLLTCSVVLERLPIQDMSYVSHAWFACELIRSLVGCAPIAELCQRRQRWGVTKLFQCRPTQRGIRLKVYTNKALPAWMSTSIVNNLHLS